MEGIHGVDVSWLHHSPKDRNAQKTAVELPDVPKKPPESLHKHHLPHVPKANGTSPSQPQPQPRRSSLLHRSASEKHDSPDSSASSSKSQKDQRPPSGSRKSSWVSSLSSKFSSSSNAPSTKSAETFSIAKGPKSPPLDNANPFGAAVSPGAKEEKKSQEPAAANPSGSPGKAHGFLQSAMRRLSASGGASMGKAAAHGGICPRRTMNIDPYRERCALPDLEQKKLRRVAFSVDVEIAGSAQYGQTEDTEPHEPSLTIYDESPQTKLEREVEEKKKQRDQQLKKSEGDALKRSTSSGDEKETQGEENPTETAAVDDASALKNSGEEPKVTTKKKEKKKRSEGERKERKERRQREALANGNIPAEIHKEGSGTSSSGVDTPPSHGSPSRTQDRPTTDPLRIYRRCCQLRETPTLKSVVEQISSPTASPAENPGIVSCIDLSGHMLQLPDIITLGDYLAVVPVKRLNLENCGLGDEAVRVILAGLLAAKTPEQAKFNRKLTKKHASKCKGAMERLGVIEKLNFKNNPKIGKEGWRHIALFIHLSRSLKAIDLSMIPFPQHPIRSESVTSLPPSEGAHTPMDLPSVIVEAISNRLANKQLEELVMSSCGLKTETVSQIVDAVIKCGVTRLGLASNNLDREGLEHVLRYVRSGQCQGLDIGGNDIRNHLNDFASAIDEKSPLFAISLADCKLDPSSLEQILPALLRLSNFRFIDLSHNRDLFTAKPSCLKILRKYLPQFPMLKRLHLLDVAMTPEHAIAIAEVLPECKHLAHLNILENTLLSPLADARTETAQEEACALYASFMAAVRVSETLICIDLDVPTPESSEIVKALAKQVVFYSLQNLEALPLVETSDSAIAAMTEPHGGDKDLTVPDVLLHLVGHMEGHPENEDNDPPAPDNDYIVGGTGVVKALDICLKRSIDGRKSSMNASPMESGTGTPQGVLQGSEVSKGKAKEMSKNLLGSARKIRARLQPALVKEAHAGNDMDYRRLKFLDSTLEGMIQRFEDEYPETRLDPTGPPSPEDEIPDSLSSSTALKPAPSQTNLVDLTPSKTPSQNLTALSRQSSSRSLASKQAQEEGRMHRFGQRLRREILKPDTEDHVHGTTGTEEQASHMQVLRRRLEEIDGPAIERKVSTMGIEGVLEAIGASAKELERAEREGEDCKQRRLMRERALAIYRDEVVEGEGKGDGSGGVEEGDALEMGRVGEGG